MLGFATPMNGRDDTPRIAHRLLRARDWQDRPQFGELCDWWRGGHGGVCALVGIGGAGKTAIADRFVRSLPGVLPSPDVAVDDTLTPPRRLFVFSFYDAPNPDAFFVELAAWLDDSPEDAKVSYERTVRRLEKEAGVLLVLDGLERVQDTGERSGYFGRILDGRLRDLVLRAAEGWLPRARLLITSRFQLFDPLAEGSRRFRQIPVAKLTPEAAVALLRQRGVRGPDHRLEAMARDQGFHALSVDLLGGYVGRFLGGDPARLTPDAAAPAPGVGVDPRMAAVREQERRFARLAERYAEALGDSDPAALALLQRACLFRLGAGVTTLASIFTGEDKEGVAGPELARLDEAELEAKLALLAEMKLLEHEDERYSVHPAVRDGFLKTLDQDTSRRGHEAAREGLEVSLGDAPGANPSDPATLDLLEEIVHHALAAGHVDEAWDVHRNRIGGFKNLGWRLGAYERGERICRAFARGRPPEDAPLPEGLSEDRQALLVNEWALYLGDLGHLAAAARCFERANEHDYKNENWPGASAGNQNLTYVLLLTGRLDVALGAAEEALRLAERADDAWRQCDSHAYRGHARALRGETTGAIADFRDALHWQNEKEKKPDRPLYSLPGIWRTLLLARLGRSEEATRLTDANKDILGSLGQQHQDIPKCNLILADLARAHHDLDTARQFLDAAHEWAIARDAKETLCWAALVRTRLERNMARGSSVDGAPHVPYDDARRAVEDGLRIARDCGFGIYHIDLLLLRARLALEKGAATTANADVDIALFKGVSPQEESGLPKLLAATDPECGYAWGEAEGRQLRAESLLHQAAWLLACGDFAPARAGELPEGARRLIEEARQELETCRGLREKIQDPEVTETRGVLEQLDGGVLTRHLLSLVTASGEEDMSDEALKIYIDKLAFFEAQLAKTSDAGQEFSLKREIKEIKAKIADLGGQVPAPSPAKPAVAPAKPATVQDADTVPDANDPTDVGVIVALVEEFDQLYPQLPSPVPVKDADAGGYDYLFNWPADGAQPYRCAATFVGEMGPIDAALAAKGFLRRRRPRTIVMLGIAAGIHDDAKLGDVIVARSVGLYLDRAKVVDRAKEVDGAKEADDAKSFDIRPGGKSFPCSQDLVRSTQNLKFAHTPIHQAWRDAGETDLAEAVPQWQKLRDKGWLTAAPAFLAGDIASGPVVAAAAPFVAWVRSVNRKYLGLEMEGGGVLAAVYERADPTRSLILRGVSDFGDARKQELDEIGSGGLRRVAMRNAVRLLWSLLEAGELPRAE